VQIEGVEVMIKILYWFGAVAFLAGCGRLATVERGEGDWVPAVSLPNESQEVLRREITHGSRFYDNLTSNPSVWQIISEKRSLDGLTKVCLYQSGLAGREGESPSQLLKISTSESSWGIRPPEEALSWFGDFEFLDNEYLLFSVNSATREQQSVFNLAAQKCTVIGGGKAAVLRAGKNKGLIRLSGQKHYFPKGGAFWVDLLVDRDGELIEGLSAPRWSSVTRIPLTLVLDPDKSYSMLRQPRHARIYVRR